jgi:hypothetical protein
MEPLTWVDNDGIVHIICSMMPDGQWQLAACLINIGGMGVTLDVRVPTCVACIWACARPGKRGAFVTLDRARESLASVRR